MSLTESQTSEQCLYSAESGVLLFSEEEPQRNRYGVKGKAESGRWEELGIFRVSTSDKFLKRLRWAGRRA